MSIAVLIGVHDGLVLAADSASSLTVTVAPSSVVGIANVYDNANKIFYLYKGKPIGCVTFGAGSIGNSSIGTLIKDLRVALMNAKRQRSSIHPEESRRRMRGRGWFDALFSPRRRLPKK